MMWATACLGAHQARIRSTYDLGARRRGPAGEADPLNQNATLKVAPVLTLLPVAEKQARAGTDGTAGGLELAQRLIRELDGWPARMARTARHFPLCR